MFAKPADMTIWAKLAAVSTLTFICACGTTVADTGGSGGSVGSGGSGGSGGTGGSPPTMQCPTELPIDGSNCDAAGTCEYQTSACGSTQDVTATCVAVDNIDRIDHFWSVPLQSCNGDPAACADYDHPTLCKTDSSCRWLFPGCGEPETTDFAEGCYEISNCTTCDVGETCTPLTNDPCHVFCSGPGCSSCAACGEEVTVCLAD